MKSKQLLNNLLSLIDVFAGEDAGHVYKNTKIELHLLILFTYKYILYKTTACNKHN
jgi:hypothetical protein